MIKSKRVFTKLSDREKNICLKLLNKTQILDYLSSESSEGDEKSFKENYGTTFAFANKSINKLLKTLIERSSGESIKNKPYSVSSVSNY